MTGNKSLFSELKPFNGGTVAFGNNDKGTIEGKGKIYGSANACIENVLYVMVLSIIC